MKSLTIRARTLFTGSGELRDRLVHVENGIIADVRPDKRGKVDCEGIVTPAFIDPHSHIGMFREGEPGNEQEGNDIIDQILPLSDPLNGVYFDDRAFVEAVDFGVLYSCIMPGSGNLIGGRSRIIKTFAANRDTAVVRDFGYKMALGYNPRSTQGWKGERPNTRMGVYGLLERKLDEALAKDSKSRVSRERKLTEVERKVKKKELKAAEAAAERRRIEQEFELELTPHEKALVELATGKKPIKVHVHKEDDVLYLIDLAKRYGMRVTAEHTGDVHHVEIFDKLADAGIPVVYGPLGSFAYKVELRQAYYRNAKLLMQSRAEYGLMTDHPVIHVTALRDSLKFFLINGMSHADAISLVTRRNAEVIGIGKTHGAIEKGKVASLLVWDTDPLHLSAIPKVVVAEGTVVRA